MLLPALVLSAQAEDTTLRIRDPQPGFQGVFKVGQWSPLELTITGPANEIASPVIVTADPDGRPTRYLWPDVMIPDSGEIRIQGLFRSGRLQAPVQILLNREGVLQDTVSIPTRGPGDSRSLKQSDQIWLIGGAHPEFEAAAAKWNETSSGNVSLIHEETLTKREIKAESLDGLDLIVLNAGIRISNAYSQAIEQWVLRGGRLVVSVGDGVEALEHSLLSDWLPLKPAGQTEIRSLEGLNDALPGSSRLRLLHGALPAAELDANHGTVLARGLTFPLIVRTACGLGQVTMLSIQTDQRPITDWEPDSLADLAMLLSGLTAPWKEETLPQRRTGSGDLAMLGVSDLSTQLLHSLDHFEEVRRPSHWVVMGWIALFALLVGPLDYFLFRRVFKRPQWTWVTLPVWILLASWWGVARGNSLNEHSPAPRQLEIADLDLTSGITRVHSWYGEYSDQNRRQKLVAEPEHWLRDPGAAFRRLRTSWPQRPEEGFRGMYRPGTIDEALPTYDYTRNRAGFENLPVQIWSSAAVACDWETSTPGQPLATFHLLDPGNERLSGTFTHHFPVEITDWFIAYGSFGYFPRQVGAEVLTLKPGEAWNVDRSGSRLLRNELVGLSQWSVQESKTRYSIQTEKQTYDPLGRDPLTIARILSFHEAAGGKNYTGLDNSPLKRLDLSELLLLNRAVLFARVPLSATTYQVDGTPVPPENREIFIRMILPVERQVRRTDQPPSPETLQLR